MKRDRILLVNPWIHDFAAYDLWAKPMGLLVLANLLRSAGFEVAFLDCLDSNRPDMPALKRRRHSQGRFHRAEIPKPEPLAHVARKYCRYGVSPELIRRDLASQPAPDLIMCATHMTYWYTGVAETIQTLKEAYPETPIWLGGVYATLLPEHAKKLGVQQVVGGPAENVIFKRLAEFTSTPAVSSPPVIGFSPALDLLSSVDYLPLLTTRGCPYSCSYCASKRISPPFTRRPLDETLAEIESAIRMYGIRDIALYDDSFLFHAQEHALPLLRASAERFPGVRWHSPNGLHASCIDAEVAAVMKKAGFKTIRLGLERTQDGFHSRTGGKITPAGFLKAVRHLREAGFSQRRIGAYLLVGLPGQTPEDVLEDVEIVLDAGAHPKLAEYSPIPGTGMWDEATQDGEHGFMHEPLLQNCTLLSAGGQGVDSEFIQALRVRISREMGALNPEEE